MTISSHSRADQQRARLKKGDPAPFAGVLLSNKALAKIISGYEDKIRKLKLELARAEKVARVKKESAETVCNVRTKSCETIRTLSEKSAKTLLTFYQGELEKARAPPPWYVSPYLHLFLGCAACGGICVGTFSAATNLTQSK